MYHRYRQLMILLCLLPVLIAACAAPAVDPQAASRTYRIGYIGAASPGPLHAVLLDELGRLGYVVGENLTIEYRWAEGKSERLPELAREMAAVKLDAIFASGEVAAQPLLEAGADAPIVMVT